MTGIDTDQLEFILCQGEERRRVWYRCGLDIVGDGRGEGRMGDLCFAVVPLLLSVG